MESESRAEPEHHPRVARADHYHLAAGSYIWTTALANDFDPDGDKFTARVTRIEFGQKEWTGMDRDGTFSYVAGANARIAMKKVIVYHLVDARGMKSRSAKITIDIDKPGIRRPSPLDKHPTKAKSAANAHWYANAGTIGYCRGVGFDHECFGVMSPPLVGALNATTPWLTPPSPAKVAKECLQHGATGGGLACARALTLGPLFRAADKQIIKLAANAGSCLTFRQTVDRTLRHPRAGEWSKPEFHPIHSYLPQGNWGTWQRGLTKKWQLPVSCLGQYSWKLVPGDRIAL